MNYIVEKRIYLINDEKKEGHDYIEMKVHGEDKKNVDILSFKIVKVYWLEDIGIEKGNQKAEKIHV